MEELLPELLEYLFTFFDRYDKRILSMVNKKFYSLSGSEKIHNSSFSERIAERGYLNILKWMKDSKYIVSARAFVGAASVGNIPILEWCRENKIETSEPALEAAAKKNRIDSFEWLKKHGYKFDLFVCEKASKHSQLGALQWLHENGCP